VVALLHAPHGALTRVLVGVTTQQVVEQPLPHRAIRHAHRLDTELLEDFGEYRHATRKRQLAIVGDCAEFQITNVLEPRELVNDAVEPAGADVDRRRIELADRVADCPDGPGTAHGFIESAAAERRLVRLDRLARRDACALHPLLRQTSVGEKLLADPDTTDLQALELERIEPLADDELGAATTDVAHEPAPGAHRHRV
jgi:hypothetical protein